MVKRYMHHTAFLTLLFICMLFIARLNVDAKAVGLLEGQKTNEEIRVEDCQELKVAIQRANEKRDIEVMIVLEQNIEVVDDYLVLGSNLTIDGQGKYTLTIQPDIHEDEYYRSGIQEGYGFRIQLTLKGISLIIRNADYGISMRGELRMQDAVLNFSQIEKSEIYIAEE